jgi:hypothetical protein
MIRLTLSDLQNPRKPGPKPGEKYYRPETEAKSNRCEVSFCNRAVGDHKNNYRFVDDRLVRLCDECLLKYDQKQEGKNGL